MLNRCFLYWLQTLLKTQASQIFAEFFVDEQSCGKSSTTISEAVCNRDVEIGRTVEGLPNFCPLIFLDACQGSRPLTFEAL